MVVGYVALGLWFGVALALFLALRPSTAAGITFLGAALFLPNWIAVDLPALPPIGKEEVASLAAVASCLLLAQRALRTGRLGRGPEILLVPLVLGSWISIFGNQHPLTYGTVVVAGTKSTEFVSRSIQLLLLWGVPFVVGRVLFVRSRDVRQLLILMAVAGAFYSLFILLELRLSPQLHRWTYGFHQHGFYQTIREGGGYRPMVYMRHGLHVAFFVFMSLTATLTLVRLRHRFFGLPAAWVGAYLSIILVLCKSTGALAYAMLIGPLVLFAKPRLQMRAALILASLIVLYPFVRSFDLVPVTFIEDVAEAAAGPKRAHSLMIRLRGESDVVEFTMDQIWFGWGNAGRGLRRDEITGRATVVFDGFWVVALAEGGVVAVASIFGLLLFPVFAASRKFPRIRSPGDRTLVAGLSLMVVISTVDLLPNSTTEGYLTLMSGALAGALAGILREQNGRGARRVRPARPGSSLGDGLLAARRPSAGAHPVQTRTV